jgi:hypothetical protein
MMEAINTRRSWLARALPDMEPQREQRISKWLNAALTVTVALAMVAVTALEIFLIISHSKTIPVTILPPGPGNNTTI